MLDFIKKISVIYLSIAMVFIVTQGCAEIKQGATRKFNDFTSWLDEMDQKIQRNIKKTGSVNTGNKDGFTISSAAPALDGSSCQFRHIRLRLAFFPLAPGKIRHEPRLEPLKAGKTLF